MTEVGSYPVPHRLGAPSHRPIAPAPPPQASAFAPNILYEMSFQPSANEQYFGPSRPHLGARSSSVSSSSSSASYNAASSRTLSPALSVSESLAGNNIMARSHHQQPFQRPLYLTQTQQPVLYNSPSQYWQAQVQSSPQYPQTPAPRPLTQATNYGFLQASLPTSQPTTMPFQPYTSGYSAFATPTYQAPSELLPSYHHHLPLAHLRQAHFDDKRTPIIATAVFPPEILNRIIRHLSYLDAIRLSQVNRWLHDNVNFHLIPEEEKISFILSAEREYERYSFRAGASSAPGGQGGRDSGHLSCYHCFKIKEPGEFELFRYNDTEQEKDNDTNPSTTRMQPETLPTSNPHYDPSITRSSIAKGRPAKGASTGSTSASQPSPRIRETWGIRRFCIDCGVKKGFYKAGALIELRSGGPGKDRRGRKGEHGKDQREVKWICQCLKVHKKPRAIRCDVCGSLTPFSQDRGLLQH